MNLKELMDKLSSLPKDKLDLPVEIEFWNKDDCCGHYSKREINSVYVGNFSRSKKKESIVISEEYS